ncbi:MAG: hypothetical protein M3O46_19505 [Myxococcota bacterium]|nr:hypothetical protein [Myxococcota bacterium]
MHHALRRIAFALLAQSWIVLLVACGGQSSIVLPDAGDAGTCIQSLPGQDTVCTANKVWNPVSCKCESIDDAMAPDSPDAATPCPLIACPAGTVEGVARGVCGCLPVEAGVVVDAVAPMDARQDVASADASQDSAPGSTDASYDAPFYDSPYNSDASSSDASNYNDAIGPYYFDARYQYDAPYSYDAPYYYDSPFTCGPTACGPGYEATPSCQCLACTNACPVGQTPMAGCGGCGPCGYQCPAGFGYGSGCNCGPPGTDAGPNPGPDSGPVPADAGGVTCLLQGYYACSAGSWCQLGICPDNTTQYGCYCNADGTATCNLICPAPPPCTIPGQGTCAYGAQCVYDSCAADASSMALVCSCYGAGNASCYTTPCSNLDGGVDGAVATDGGVTCMLEGYRPCSAGSWCPLGICPDNTTEYGCTCNADGTATCRLTCPAPPPCTIPGEGVCPYGTSCVFGTCSGNTGTQLVCNCNAGGSAYCNTVPCGAADGGGPG